MTPTPDPQPDLRALSEAARPDTWFVERDPDPEHPGAALYVVSADGDIVDVAQDMSLDDAELAAAAVNTVRALFAGDADVLRGLGLCRIEDAARVGDALADACEAMRVAAAATVAKRIRTLSDAPPAEAEMDKARIAMAEAVMGREMPDSVRRSAERWKMPHITEAIWRDAYLRGYRQAMADLSTEGCDDG